MTGFKTGTPTKDGNYKVLVKWNEGGNIADDNDYSVLSLQFINGTWYDFKNGGLTADNGFSYNILGWTEEESQWHTGEPTEEGNYIAYYQYEWGNYTQITTGVLSFKNGIWEERFNVALRLRVIAWIDLKIKPYKGA